jgi:hypothetical protein
MNQEDINELTDKSMPTWLSDQRLSEAEYGESLLDCRQNIVDLKAEVARLKEQNEWFKSCNRSRAPRQTKEVDDV